MKKEFTKCPSCLSQRKQYKAGFNPSVNDKFDIVLFIDATDMGEQPDTVICIGMDEIDWLPASTHSLPLSVFAGCPSLELGCDVLDLGIQPSSEEFGTG